MLFLVREFSMNATNLFRKRGRKKKNSRVGGRVGLGGGAKELEVGLTVANELLSSHSQDKN